MLKALAAVFSEAKRGQMPMFPPRGAQSHRVFNGVSHTLVWEEMSMDAVHGLLHAQ